MSEIFTITYHDPRLDLFVLNANTILNDIIIKSDKPQYNITLYLDSSMNEDTFGFASWYSEEIWLNENKMNGIVTLNDVEYNVHSVVLIHEILHIFGAVGVGNNGYQYIRNENNDPPNVYIGEHGIKQYKNVLQENGFDVSNIEYLPIENNFGNGTVRTHLEEGEDENFDIEIRYINGRHYPVIPNEIMTGFIDSHNYITPITLGLLEDMGFTVNYDSIYVSSVGNHLKLL